MRRSERGSLLEPFMSQGSSTLVDFKKKERDGKHMKKPTARCAHRGCRSLFRGFHGLLCESLSLRPGGVIRSGQLSVPISPLHLVWVRYAVRSKRRISP